MLAFSFRNSRELHGLGQGELYALVLALTLSSLLLAAANDMVMLYLALEMVSITSYVMVAYLKGDRMSNEASLKYVLFGAASTGSMLYGLSLLYGMTGTTSLPAIQAFLAGGIPDGEPLRGLRDRAARDRRLRLQDRGGARSTSGAPTCTRARRRRSPRCSRCCRRPPASAITLRFFYGTFSSAGADRLGPRGSHRLAAAS